MNIPYAFKKCTKCGEWLVANKINFYKDKKGKWGFKSCCKKCDNKRKKNHIKNNKEHYKEYSKEYYENNKEHYKEYSKEYYENNKEYLKEYSKEYYKEYYKEYKKNNRKYFNEKNKIYRKNNPQVVFNYSNKRRNKLENQGRGITKEQYKECFEWFDWKCAYSGEKLQKNNSIYGRTLDHIVALDNGGLNEIWNLIPMRLGYNSSKKNRVDTLDWYMEQEYFDIDRLNKIVEWQIYAYEKWGGEEFGELILITDLFEEEE